jgi:sugar phosphate isomerase/epimerase
MITRRRFIARTGALGLGAGCTLALGISPGRSEPPLYRISLAQWSLHLRLLGRSKPVLDNLDFAATAHEMGFEAVEYVNTFFKKRAQDETYLGEMRKRARDHGVSSLLIMVDGEGDLGDPDAGRRRRAVERHHRWVDAAKFLGCHSIRVNARSKGSPDEQMKLAADGLRQLCEYGDRNAIDVIVENHGGLSSNGKWLAATIRKVDHARCGTLPDFGNFRVAADEHYDRYQGVRELMPFAKAVSAKSHDFDEHGNEIHTDYRKMMRIVIDSGYRGWVGVEYEGKALDEAEGIRRTKTLLERVRDEITRERKR